MRKAILLLALVAVGCSSAPKEPQVKEVVVTKVEYQVKLPPESLLKDCKISQPPNPKNYAKKSYKEKELLLVTFGAEQTVNLANCNKDKAALRKWRQEQSQ